MIINLLVQENPNLSFSIDSEPVRLVDDLYIHRMTAGYEKLWQELKLEKLMHVALKKTFEPTVKQVCLYDLDSSQLLDNLGFCSVMSIE